MTTQSNENNVSLETVLALVRALDDSSVTTDGSTIQFLEIKKEDSIGGVAIGGNVGGLVHFARLVLEVAKKGYRGAHQHLDENSETDTCEVSLVIRFEPAVWDI